MEKSGLSCLALVLVFLVIFFTILTQRIMIGSNFPFPNKDVFLDIVVMTKNSTIPNRISGSQHVKIAGHGLLNQTFLNYSNYSKNLKNKMKQIQVTKDPIRLDTTSSQGNNHSPRNGTDISSSHQMTILQCPNQSRCIVPELQLKRSFKVYFCKRPVNFGVRFYFLAREGLLLHPRVSLVDESNMRSADVIIYLPGSSPWHKTECANTSFAKKLIVLDEGDGHQIYNPYGTTEQMIKAVPKFKKTKAWYYLYFKRSFVGRRDGIFHGYPHLDKPDIYPLVYTIAEAYVRTKFNFVREIDIACTLRETHGMTTRKRVQDWVAEYSLTRNITNVIAKEVRLSATHILIFLQSP